MKKDAKTTKRIIAILLSIILAVGSFGSISAGAATQANGIVKGSNTPGVETSYTTTLSSGEATTIKIVSSVLTINVDGDESVFKIGNISKTSDAAVVNEKDALLHILTLGGAYYVLDLYTGVQIMAYRNSMNGQYCSSRNAYAYVVLGKSLINNTYFYELLTSNSVIREKLMSRQEFDIISGGGDPSLDIVEPTEAPTEAPTVKPTEAPTEAPTVKPTEAPTQAPTVKPTEAPTQAPTVKPTEAPTEAPTVKPTEAPTQAPTVKPTEAPTQAPTVKPTEAPTQAPSNPKPIFYFEYWWCKYESKIITFDQFLGILLRYGWSYMPDSTGYIYYFYDECGAFYTIKVIQAPTEAPTVKPTEAPTQAPTVKPTEAPTQAPSNPKPIFYFEYWWCKYESKIITFDQFLGILLRYGWSYMPDSTGYIYYFYDECGAFYTTKVIQVPTTEVTEAPTQVPTVKPTETPTQIPTTEPTEVPTQVPTTEPTEAPTQAPTVKPTEIPTQVPTVKPTEAPTQVPTTEVTEVPTQAPTVKPTEADTTIIKPKKPILSKDKLTVYVKGITKKLTIKNATSPVKWTASNKKVKLTCYGENNKYCQIKGLKKGQVVVTAKCNGYTYKVLVTVKKVHARVITSGKRIKLFVGKNRLHGWLIFNSKKGMMNYNGYKVKGVKTCGFVKGSWNVIFIKKNGKAYILPKKAINQRHKKRVKLGEKAIALNRDTYGFVSYIKTACGGLKNVSGK